jgi:hypothetical protein
MDISLRQAILHFPRPRLEQIEERVSAELNRARHCFAGRKVIGIAVGSRGVANIARIVKAVVEQLRGWGAEPFILPAMGSHGGATAEGQAHVLACYGVTPEAMGCEVRSSMEVTELPPGDLPHKLYMDRHALAADGILLINRIKPHTDFHGRYESGLVKMAVIGLGKEKQALEMHHFGTRGLRDLVPRAAEVILSRRNVIGGLAVVENACDETARIDFLAREEILSREPELLEEARRNMPRLPVDHLDLLIVDEMGKDISGTGMDTNIIGRIRIPGEPEPKSPAIKAILVNDLTAATHGNATGMGLADVITQRFFRKIDFSVTNRNIATSGFLERGKMPFVAENAREGCLVALRSAGPILPGAERIIRIRNTLQLEKIMVSEAIARELKNRPEIELGERCSLFSPNGELELV